MQYWIITKLELFFPSGCHNVPRSSASTHYGCPQADTNVIPLQAITEYVTHLHKTSYKSPNIKWQKIEFHLKMSRMCYFLFSSKQHFWARLFQKYLGYLHYSARFFTFLWPFGKFV